MIPSVEETKDLLLGLRTSTGWSLRRAAQEFPAHYNTINGWEKKGEKGTSVDQLRWVAMVARRFPAARFLVLKFFGVPVSAMEPEPEEEMQERVERLRVIQEAAKRDPSLQYALDGIDLLIERTSSQAAGA